MSFVLFVPLQYLELAVSPTILFAMDVLSFNTFLTPVKSTSYRETELYRLLLLKVGEGGHISISLFTHYKYSRTRESSEGEAARTAVVPPQVHPCCS